ncbi:MAG: hypothetical protein H7281_15105 [Bacteriovorax sp.]|nr:hypothetical protein [Bacteriovorax sp.]
MKYLVCFVMLISYRCFSAPIELSKKFSNKIFVEDKLSDQGSVTNEKKLKINSPKNHIRKSMNAEAVSLDYIEVKDIDKANSLLLKKYLDKNSLGIWDFSNQYDLKTGSVIKGRLLNSVVSSNLESPLLVETVEAFEGLPSGTLFSCVGVSKNKRVLTACNRLITNDDEYDVETILLNLDGTAGLLGKFYSGKEQFAVGAITAATLKQGLDVSLDRVINPLGMESVTTSAKNKIKSGGIGALDEIIQMNTDEYKTTESKLSIDAGTKILIYFTRRFKI